MEEKDCQTEETKKLLDSEWQKRFNDYLIKQAKSSAEARIKELQQEISQLQMASGEAKLYAESIASTYCEDRQKYETPEDAAEEDLSYLFD